MQRTDRLFEIISILRSTRETGRKPVTAQQLAQALEVTPRTIYRYIATLQSMRVPIEGAAGVGYVMRAGYDLPALNFSTDELEAIVIGIGMLARTGDTYLQQAANRVMRKIETNNIPEGSLRVSDWGIEAAPGLADMRAAIRDEAKLLICYDSLKGDTQTRNIWPIILTYYAEVAVVSAFCELRGDFRNFRIDRITEMKRTGQGFVGKGAALRLAFLNSKENARQFSSC